MPQYSNILRAIGNTPLVRLNRITAGIASPIYVKAEMLNPGGTIVEATSPIWKQTSWELLAIKNSTAWENFRSMAR